MSTASNLHRSRLRGRRSQQWGAVGGACWEVLEERRLMSFAPAVNYAAGADPSEIISADFNNDGRLDLVVANPTANSVNVLQEVFDSRLVAGTPRRFERVTNRVHARSWRRRRRGAGLVAG